MDGEKKFAEMLGLPMASQRFLSSCASDTMVSCVSFPDDGVRWIGALPGSGPWAGSHTSSAKGSRLRCWSACSLPALVVLL